MRYQDPPGSQDPAQDPRRRPPTERAPARHRGSHQRPQGRQDQGRSQGQGRSQDQGWSQGQSQDQGWSQGQARSQDQGWSPGQARSQDQGWSQGQGRSQGQGQSQDPGWSQGQSRSQDQGWFEGQGRSGGQGGSWGSRTPGSERYPDASQAVFLAPRRPDRRGDGDQDAPWDSALTQDAPGGPPTWHDEPGRAGRGLLAGALTGVLAAAIALGVAMLVSAFVRPQASPVIAVGGQVINLTPTPVKEFAVAHFGTNDKTMLLGGMYAVIALLAMVIGWLARRRLLLGAIGIGAVGALRAFVAVIQPGSRTTDAIPALVGGVAGVVAIISLVNWSAPTAFSPATGWTGDGGGGTGRIARRKFLIAGTAPAAVAAGSAVGGQILTNRRFNANASRAAVKLTAPAKKAPPLARQAEINIPGLSPFYTPNSHFYRVDTALVIPQVTTQQWSLRVHGMVGTELNISFKELLNMPMVERDITLMCVSEPVGGGYIGNARWQGVLLSDVLRHAKLRSGVSMLATTDVNGMTVGVPSQIALDGRDAILVVGMNGAPLPQEHGFPVRMVG